MIRRRFRGAGRLDGARGGSRRLGDRHGCSCSIRSGAASSLLPPFRAGPAEGRVASCAGSPGACGQEVRALLESWWGGGGAGRCCELPPAAAATVARVTGEGAQVGGSRPASSAGGRGLELPCHHGNVQLFPSPGWCQWRGARA